MGDGASNAKCGALRGLAIGGRVIWGFIILRCILRIRRSRTRIRRPKGNSRRSRFQRDSRTSVYPTTLISILSTLGRLITL